MLETLYNDAPNFFWNQQEYAENDCSLKIVKYSLYKYNMKYMNSKSLMHMIID